MPDQIQPHFEQSVLEADMARLALEMQKHRESPEYRSKSDQELLKKSIREFAPASVRVQSTAAPQDGAGVLPDYALGASAETKLEIEYLIEVAFTKGLAAADAEARRTHPFVLDAFHDALATKLYPELQKRGMLK